MQSRADAEGSSAATHFITGAGSGIGAAVARRLHQRGDLLWLLARDEQRADVLTAQFPGARTVVADLGQPEKIGAALADQPLPEHLDSLLHIAGTLDLASIAGLTPARWQATLAVNLIAPAELTRLLLPALRRSRSHVVFVNSTSGLSSRPGCAAYSAAKYGLRVLADVLRDEERARGIRVTSIYPSRTATPMQARMHQYEGRPYDPARWIDPESIATTITTALDLTIDAELTDVTIRPRG
jgi:NAD(P)-dependent dehydrogenase (short-subunit alcohol dehydrogenase family)